MYYVYILVSKNNKALYTGVTNNLERRFYEHKYKMAGGFTRNYNVCKLVYFDTTSDVNEAIAREKQIKALTRYKKEDLINQMNPEWKNLSEEW
jgi:putative endonuclease